MGNTICANKDIVVPIDKQLSLIHTAMQDLTDSFITLREALSPVLGSQPIPSQLTGPPEKVGTSTIYDVLYQHHERLMELRAMILETRHSLEV